MPDREPIESRPIGNGAMPPAMEKRMAAQTEGKPPNTVLGKALYEQLSVLAMAVFATGDMYCGTILAQNAAPLATAWDDLAKKNAKVKEILEMLVAGGAWSGALIATATVALPIAQHHGVYPRHWPNPFNLGMPPPSEEVEEHGSKHGPYPGPAAGWPGAAPPADADQEPPGDGTAAAD